MGWHEWPLIFFTVFAQTAVGAFIVMGLITLFGKADAHVKTAITRNMFFYLGVHGTRLYGINHALR